MYFIICDVGVLRPGRAKFESVLFYEVCTLLLWCIMDVFLMVQRKKMVIFLDMKEYSPVEQVKKIIEGITQVPTENQQLYKGDKVMDSSKTLRECGITRSTAKTSTPALIGLTYKDESTGEFEAVELEPFSTPELPDESAVDC